MQDNGSVAVDLVFRGRKVTRDRALVMAIINRTPDSFYDQGATFDEQVARTAITKAMADGADLIDIGGVPALPGPEVTVDEEIRRVLPTVEWARETYPDLVISVDTWRHEVAERVCQAGADILNDNWAAADPAIIDVAAEYGTGYVCSHTDGLAPRTRRPDYPRYDDVVAAVVDGTTRLAEQAVARGVPREGVLIDPAISFAKTVRHDLIVLRHTHALVETGWPVLIALSNKGFVADTLDVDRENRVTGTLAATAFAAQAGASMFRAHQVRETVHTVDMLASIAGVRPPARS